MKTILLATDGSEHGAEALRYAIELARENDAELHVLAVRPPVFFGPGGPMYLTRLAEVPDAAAIAAAAAAEASEAGVRAVPHDVEGDGAEAIVAVAASLDADLVVVGSRGSRATGDRLLGSVSRAVVLSCPIAVTVVRRPYDAS